MELSTTTTFCSCMPCSPHSICRATHSMATAEHCRRLLVQAQHAERQGVQMQVHLQQQPRQRPWVRSWTG